MQHWWWMMQQTAETKSVKEGGVFKFQPDYYDTSQA
jgi:hypothetical protein